MSRYRGPEDMSFEEFLQQIQEGGRRIRQQENREDVDALVDRKHEEMERKKMKEAFEKILSFNKTPKEIKEGILDRYVIGQEEGKKVLSVGVSYHFKRVTRHLKELIETGKNNEHFQKKNILIIGPTGVGKTYSVEKISQILETPFVKEDITKFTASGYVGRDLEEIAIDLYVKAQENIHLAQCGICYLDEIDKIASRFSWGKDVNGLEVQNGLLKIVEGSNVRVKDVDFDTRYVLFIGSGSFHDMKRVVENMMKLNGEDPPDGDYDWYRHIQAENLLEYGMEPEFVGRFPIRVIYHALNKGDFVRILKESGDSPLKQYIQDLKEWNIELTFSEKAIEKVAELAHQKQSGARSIIMVLERSLMNIMYELPGVGEGKVEVTEDMITDQ